MANLTTEAPGVQRVFPILVSWVVFFLALATLSRLLMEKTTSSLISGAFGALATFYKGVNFSQGGQVGAQIGPPVAPPRAIN